MARNAAKFIQALKSRIAKIERLAGKVVVVEDGRLVTTYQQAKSIRPVHRRPKTCRRARARERVGSPAGTPPNEPSFA